MKSILTIICCLTFSNYSVQSQTTVFNPGKFIRAGSGNTLQLFSSISGIHWKGGSLDASFDNNLNGTIEVKSITVHKELDGDGNVVSRIESEAYYNVELRMTFNDVLFSRLENKTQ